MNSRNGIRKTRLQRQPYLIPKLGHYYVLTDTKETENNYLNGFKESLPIEAQKKIIIEVLKTKTNGLIEEAEKKKSLNTIYAETWIVFDRDQVLDFDEIIEQAKKKGIHVGWSNPCIEIWFHAYYGKMPTPPGGKTPSVKCCESFSSEFKKKTGKDYIKSDEEIYSILVKTGDEKKAIMLAEKRYKEKGEVAKNSEKIATTTLHYLIREIKRKIRDQEE